MNDLDKISNIEELNRQINYLIGNEKGKKYLKENFEKIKNLFLSKKNHIHVNNFFQFIKSLKDIPEFEEEYEDYSYWANLYEEIEIPEYGEIDIMDIFKMSEPEIAKINREREAKEIKPLEFSRILLSEDKDSRYEKRAVLQNEAKGEKYKYKSCGSSCLVIQTGDKIVKLASGRRKFEIPYHPRIMMPHFRKRYNDGSCLEVFNCGDNESELITDQKLIEIYKELEEAGILWGDANKRGLVVLKKDNNLPDYIDSKDFNVFGFLKDPRYPTDNHIALKAGEIVICDLEMLYAKDDPEYELGDIDDIMYDYFSEKRKKAEDTEYSKD